MGAHRSIQSRSRVGASILCALSALATASPGSAQIVDIDAIKNGKTNPVVVLFEPGLYQVQPIGKAREGKYDGYLLNDSNSSSYSNGYAYSSDEFGERVFWDQQLYPTAAQAMVHAIPSQFSLVEAGQVRFHVHDDLPDDNRGGISLLVTREDSLSTLGFEGLEKHECNGPTYRYSVSATLTTGAEPCERPGPSSWSIAIAPQGLKVVSATTEGTAADVAPVGNRLDGFEMTEITQGTGNEGVISVVSLSADGSATLDPCSSYELLKLTLETSAPVDVDCKPVRLSYADRRGSGGNVANELTVGGLAIAPFGRKLEFDVCQCKSRVAIEPLSAGSVRIVLDHEIPITGGELGISYDPARMVPVEVQPGPDFPGDVSDLLVSLDAPVNCNGAESDVEAGFILGWINQGRGSTLEPGSHSLFEVRFAVSDAGEGGLCTPLRFVRCLGTKAAPVQNIVTDLANSPVQAATVDGSVCSGLEVFERGDVNGDHRFDISDAIANLRCLFAGEGCGACPDATDANDDSFVDISDSIYLLRWRFLDGAPPASPFGTCGIDRTPDALGACGQPEACPAGA